MTITRNNEGSIIISEMVTDFLGNEFYTNRVYQGYTVKEAKEKFNDYLQQENLQVA